MKSHQPYTLSLMLLFIGGCGTPLPPTANPVQAQSAIKTALDTWQKGESAESLQSSSPAIYVNDFGWDRKDRLVRYEILSGHASGQSWKAQVLLTIQYPNGAQMQHEANYTVETNPSLVIVREFE